MERVIHGRPLVAGEVAGEMLCSPEPLSFWGGYDQHSGEIIDRRHPLAGENAAGKILAIPFTRGSSTTTAVLLEAVRQGHAPAAILTTGIDSFLALASIVADEMYGRPFPVISVDESDFESLETGQWVNIRRDGAIETARRPAGTG
ncbi:MAG: aconitase X swivel domain-containing protein [Acidobacteriota bacterium]